MRIPIIQKSPPKKIQGWIDKSKLPLEAEVECGGKQ